MGNHANTVVGTQDYHTLANREDESGERILLH